MSTVAEQLRYARQAQNLTIHQVAEITKIRTDHIRALEDGNYAAFSAPVYIRGFVRCYAALLKLDVQQITAALDAELGPVLKPPPPPSSSLGLVDFIMYWLSQVNWKKTLPILVVVVLVVLVVLGIQTWRSSKPASSSPGVKPGLYQPNSSGDTLPLPPRKS